MGKDKYKSVLNDPGQVVFREYTGSDECFVMPEEVTVVAEGAFANNKVLRQVDLSNVRSVGAYAFQDCPNLESVKMAAVSVIGTGAFEFCRSLRSVTFGNVTDIGDEAFLHCAMLDIPEMPRSLKYVGKGAFSHTGVRHADLHWLGSIPASLFSTCISLGSVDISGAGEIGDEAFSGCSALSHVGLGDVEKIGDRSFYKCDLFELVRLPDTLRYIGDDAFSIVRPGFVIPKSVRHIGKNCLGPVDIRKNIRIYQSMLYEFRNYFRDEECDPLEDDHYYLWESSIDITVMDDETGAVTGFLPLLSDLYFNMRQALLNSFRPDNTFDYSVLDTVFFTGMEWHQRSKDRIAVMRLRYPYELPDDARKEYTEYLQKHANRIAKRAVRDRDIDMLAFLYDNELIDIKSTSGILDYSISLSRSECTAFLLERQAELDLHRDPLLEEL